MPYTSAPFRRSSASRQVPHRLRCGLRSCALAGLPGCTLPRKVLDKFPVPDYPIAMAIPGPKPLELHAHAMDNLRYIRRTLERAGEFTAVPGLGGVLMGSTALVAAWIAGPRTASPRWLAVWLAEAVVALLIGIMAAALKSRRAKQSLLSGPGRKFVAAFAQIGRASCRERG